MPCSGSCGTTKRSSSWPHAAFAAFWLRGRPQSRLAQWVYQRPSLSAFRDARLTLYLKLSLIRIPTFDLQGLVLYFEMIAFGMRAPLAAVMAILPVVLAAGALPFAPSGLGTRQAAVVVGFRAFGPRITASDVASP